MRSLRQIRARQQARRRSPHPPNKERGAAAPLEGMSYRDPFTQIHAVEEFLKGSHPGDLDVLKAIHQELIRRELIPPQFGLFQTLDMLGDHVQLLRKEKKGSQTCHLSTHKGHWDIILKTMDDGSLAYEIAPGDGSWTKEDG